MAYATVNDLERRWHPLSEADRAVAEVLLDDAALMIDSQTCIDLNDPMMVKVALKVSCDMVQRAMASRESGAFGVAEQTISADIYSQRLSYSNPAGDLYLTSANKRMLGITTSYLTTLRPRMAGRHAHDCR